MPDGGATADRVDDRAELASPASVAAACRPITPASAPR
jgi:hypothetical protein